MVKVYNNDELNEAMKSKQSTIEIEGDLAKKVIRIKATGTVAWAVAFIALSVAVIAAITVIPASTATGGLALPGEAALAMSAAVPAISIMGIETTLFAIALAVAAGGVGALTHLRNDYKIIKKTENSAVLQRA